jgi:hypothetical protein
MASDLDVIPCGNGDVPFGSAKRQITEPTHRNMMLWSSIFARGTKRTYQNFAHLTNATFSLVWNLLHGAHTVSSNQWKISSTGP